MPRRTLPLPSLLTCVLLIGACGPKHDDGYVEAACTPGQTVACACETGGRGAQRCGDDGTYGECRCTTSTSIADDPENETPREPSCSETNGQGCVCSEANKCPTGANLGCVALTLEGGESSGDFCVASCSRDADCAFEGPGKGVCMRYTDGTMSCLIRCAEEAPKCPQGFSPYSLPQASVSCICLPVKS